MTVVTRRAAEPEQGAAAIAEVLGQDNRILGRRDILAALQAEAREVFANSGQTVDRFLRERDDACREHSFPT